MTVRRIAFVCAVAFAAAACGRKDEDTSRPAPAGPQDPHAGMSRVPSPIPTRPAVAWTVPQGWKEGHPSSSMRLAQFDIAADAAGDTIQCVVFGGQMGSDEDNIVRWTGEMGAGAKQNATTTKSEQGTLRVTRFAASGEYTDKMRPGEPKAIADARMLAAIVEAPDGGKLYVKLVGGKAQVDAAAKQFDEFIASMK